MFSAGMKLGWVAGFALLTACGGSGGGSSKLEPTQVTGSAVKGPIADASLTVRQANPITGVFDPNAGPLESSLTDGNGNFSLGPASANKAVFIITDGGTFVDESDTDPEADGRRRINLSSGQGLTVYKPADDSQVSITILTEAMTSRAKQLAASESISFDNAFSAVRELMTSAFSFDPLSTVALNPLAPSSNASDAEIQYALTIGGLANAVNEVSIRAGYGQMSAEVIDAFINDLSDGVIDGNNAGTPIMLNGQAMPQVDLNSAIDLFRNNNDTVYKNVTANKPNLNTLAEQPQPSNQQPTVDINVAANFTVVQGESISLNSLLNADDPDGDNAMLKLLLVEPITAGQVVDGQNQPVSPQDTPTEQLAYLASDFPQAGEVQIELAVVDEANGVAYITLPLQVNGVPQPEDDSFANGIEDTPIVLNVLVNDQDPNNDILSIDGVTPGQGGTPSIDGNQISFQPLPNFNGTATFSYSVTDGASSASASVELQIQAVNDDPIAEDETGSTLEDTPIAVFVLSNDSDPDGDSLSITGVSGETNGTAVINNGQVDFTPALNFNGQASFTYTVSDGQGGSDVGNVSITVTAVNDDPAATDDTATTAEDTLVTINVLANDTDTENDTLTIHSVDGETNGTAVINNGQVDFTPALNFNGQASFSYTVSDSQGGSDVGNVSITVTAVNDDPLAVDDTAVANHNELVTIDVLANDADPENDILTITAVTAEMNGTAIINNGQIDFTPTTGFVGTASFNYTISDGNDGSANANVTVDVQAPPAFYVAQGGSGDCSAPASPCGDINQALTAAQNQPVAHVNVAAGTYSVTGDADAVQLKPNVSLFGGWDSGFTARNPDANVTIISSTAATGPGFPNLHASMVCGAGVMDNVTVDGFSILGSSNLSAVALKLIGNCAANFTNNSIDARGVQSGDGFAVFIGNDTGPHPDATLKNNRIYGGEANLAVGVFTHRVGQTRLIDNYIEGGSVDDNGSGQAIRTQHSNTSGILILENNVITANREAIWFNVNGDVRLTNNTIYAGHIPVVLNSSPTAIEFYNNIIVKAATADPNNPCLHLGNQPNANWTLDSNAFVGCDTVIGFGTLGIGASDIDSIDLTLDQVEFAAVDIDYNMGSGSVGLFSNNGTVLTLAQNLALKRGTDCAVLYGGKEAIGVPLDITGKRRELMYDGFCSYVKEYFTLDGGLSLGAFEFELNARYVSQAGQNTGDCSDLTTPCGSIGYALSQAQQGEEVRVSDGSYLASAASDLVERAVIDKPVSLVGGYTTAFDNVPSCSPQSCLTQLGLLSNTTGSFPNDVLLCDGTIASGSMNHSNTLIAGFAISAADTNDSDGDVNRGVLMQNGCVGTVAGNLISGGNGGFDGSNQTTAIAIHDSNTDAYVFKNWLDGGNGSSLTTRGIYLEQASATIVGNMIRGNADPSNVDGSDASDSYGISIADGGATSLLNSVVVEDNSIEGGIGGNVVGITAGNVGSLKVSRNYIYGGQVSNFSGPEKTVGLLIITDGDISLINNAIHGGDGAAGGFAHGVRINSTVDNVARFTIRNNTIFSGVPSGGKSAMGVVYTQQHNHSPDLLAIDNNIIWAFIDNPPQGQRTCIKEEIDITPTFVRNNSVHSNHCPTASYSSRDGITTNNFDVAGLNTQPFASNNIDTPGFFISRDGPVGQQSQNDKDWHLDPNNGTCDIAQGALDGDNSDGDGLNFGYNQDLEETTRTDDDLGTGWSMGAFEQDSCN